MRIKADHEVEHYLLAFEIVETRRWRGSYRVWRAKWDQAVERGYPKPPTSENDDPHIAHQILATTDYELCGLLHVGAEMINVSFYTKEWEKWETEDFVRLLLACARWAHNAGEDKKKVLNPSRERVAKKAYEILVQKILKYKEKSNGYSAFVFGPKVLDCILDFLLEDGNLPRNLDPYDPKKFNDRKIYELLKDLLKFSLSHNSEKPHISAHRLQGKIRRKIVTLVAKHFPQLLSDLLLKVHDNHQRLQLRDFVVIRDYIFTSLKDEDKVEPVSFTEIACWTEKYPTQARLAQFLIVFLQMYKEKKLQKVKGK